MSCCQTSVNPSKLSDWITSPVKTWPKWISEVARSHTLRLCGQKCNVSRCSEIFSLLCHHEERTGVVVSCVWLWIWILSFIHFYWIVPICSFIQIKIYWWRTQELKFHILSKFLYEDLSLFPDVFLFWRWNKKGQPTIKSYSIIPKYTD